jgi:hypothetical protein
VVERVVVEAEGHTERVRVTIHWVGGQQTAGTVIRPLPRLADLSTYAALCERVRALTQAGLSAATIAEQVTAEGLSPPRGARLTRQTIYTLQQHLGLSRPRQRPATRDGLAADEWWASDLAKALRIRLWTLHCWIRHRRVRARQEPSGLRRWIISADAAELDRLRRQPPMATALRARWLRQEGAPHASTS